MKEIVEIALETTGAAAMLSAMNSASGAAGRAGSAIQGMLGHVLSLKTLIAGFAGGALAGQITSIGSAFENTQNRMAGSLTALGQASDFNAGLLLAQSTMQQITIDAAKLPGEAEDYVAVFSAALPQLQEAVGGGLENMTSFSNKMTAIGRTLGIDSAQIGRDMTLMLRAGQGGAGMDVRTFTTLLPFMRQVDKQANLTRESFNRMTSQDRAKLLTDTFSKLQPMLDNAANSWEAITGTSKSLVKEMTRMTTMPVFNAMKTGLGFINGLLMDSEGHWTALGEKIMFAGRMVSGMAVEVTRMASSGLFDMLMGATGGTGDIGGLLSKGLASINLNPGAIFGNITKAFDILAPVVVQIYEALQPAVALWASVQGYLYTLGSQALPVVAQAFSDLIQPVLTFVDRIIPVLSTAFENIKPQLEAMWKEVLRFGDFVRDHLAPAFSLLLDGAFEVISTLIVTLTPVLQALIEVVGDVIGAFRVMFGDILDWLNSFSHENDVRKRVEEAGGHVARKMYDANTTWEEHNRQMAAAGKGGKASEGISKFISEFSERLSQMRAKELEDRKKSAADIKGKGPKTPGARGGANVTQDFRYSRFEVQQKFAEGFDPDRIMVAFANDLGKAGEQKLSSGLEPLFATRG